MKKKLFNCFACILASTSIFAGTLKVGATPVPHAELLNYLKGDLKKEGVDLKIVEFTDFVSINEALINDELDANYWQHLPHLTLIMQKEKKTDLVAVTKVHVETIGLYSKKIKSLKELKNGSKITIPSDSTNEGRALILLHNNGIIKLKDSKNLLATPTDIISNPKKLKFQELDAALLPRTLESVDAAIITANYALQAGFIPIKDAIILEDKNSPYVNVLVTRKKNQSNEDIKKLTRALNSEKARKFINAKYKGAVVPAF